MPKDDPDSLSPLLINITDDQGRRLDFLYPGAGSSLGDAIAGYQFISGRFLSLRSNETYTSGANPQLVSYQQSDYVYDSSPANGYTHNWLSSLTTNYSWQDANNQWHSKGLAQNIYDYDTLGQRLTNQITDSTGTQHTESYVYDPLNRLISVNYRDGQTQTGGAALVRTGFTMMRLG